MDVGDGAESRKPVGAIDWFFADRASFDLSGPTDDAGDVDAAVVHVPLGAAEMARTAEGGGAFNVPTPAQVSARRFGQHLEGEA